eukprot:COSAG04_NODE_308_length_17238_cov_10.434039_6_plen_45_part_00
MGMRHVESGGVAKVKAEKQPALFNRAAQAYTVPSKSATIRRGQR